MLSRGVTEQIYDIFQLLPQVTQVVLLSATMPQNVLEVTTKFICDPVRILVKKDEFTLEGIKQFYLAAKEEDTLARQTRPKDACSDRAPSLYRETQPGYFPTQPVARPADNGNNLYSVPPVFGRQGRRSFVVTFKCSRADIYYLDDNTGLEIRPGHLVICEGDRGHDLGQVAHADVSMEDARKLAARTIYKVSAWHGESEIIQYQLRHRLARLAECGKRVRDVHAAQCVSSAVGTSYSLDAGHISTRCVSDGSIWRCQ